MTYTEPDFQRELKAIFDAAEAGDDVTDRLIELHKGHASRYVEELVSDLTAALADSRSKIAAFEIRLLGRWGTALGMYEALVNESREVGALINEMHRPTAAATDDLKFEALVRLHGKAVTTAGEVLSLLRAGYSTGALARARTLHEVSVVAFVLADEDVEIARRYLAHDEVESLKAQDELELYHQRLGYEPPDSTTKERQEAREQLKAEHGDGFLRDYGWAVPLFGHAPKLKDLRARVNLDHWAPFYRLASHGVHAGPKGTVWNVQLLGDEPMIVAGPSNAGLAEPVQQAGISLVQVDHCLLNYGLGLHEEEDPSQVANVTWMFVLDDLLERCVDAIVAAHDQQVKEEEALLEQCMRALRLLKTSPGSTTAEIAAGLNETVEAAADALARGQRSGWVTVGDTAWTLTGAGTEAVDAAEDQEQPAQSTLKAEER